MKKFNIRVYGILINENREILVLDETRGGYNFTKFPGGGLEWGEGFQECLSREFEEELGVKVNVLDIYYINEDFIPSAFHPSDQLISVYYKVILAEDSKIVQKTQFEIPRWISLTHIEEKDLTFPIDKRVVLKLKKEIV
jgi:8-oxo-dGTP diphosphatase